MSLSPKGTLRWYTSCCRTPIGNTPRDYRQSHIGLVHTCLERGEASLDESFGPIRMRVNVQGAKAPPPKGSRIGFVFAVLRYLASMTWSRLSGKYRLNPFFKPDGSPSAEPLVLSPGQRTTLRSDV
ncbi:hypothetical protein N789_10705 [Arenimonas oryziterrae DSM 21050 = YC6267]|uniref:Uncharacterized protein n=2 Tax=Arenimonas TaxID=490567 RepID=A0A091AS72_9GAMM|nr:hypothetical protein N789_10705 [Arenimonas oryziterrae DSM 21050 = YC6267]